MHLTASMSQQGNWGYLIWVFRGKINLVIDQFDKSHNEHVWPISKYTPLWNRSMYISVLMWCIVGYESGDCGKWIRGIVEFVRLVYWDIAVLRCELIVRCILVLWYISPLSSVFLNFQVSFRYVKVCQLQVNYFSFFFSQLIISLWLFERKLMETECMFKLISLILMV